MEETFLLAGLLICCCYFTIATSKYIYDDTNNARGFLTSPDLASPISRGMLNSHKKYFISNGNPKYQKFVNERAADAHFKIVKSPGQLNSLSLNAYNREDRKPKHVSQLERRQDVASVKQTNQNSKLFQKVKTITLVPERRMYIVDGQTKKTIDLQESLRKTNEKQELETNEICIPQIAETKKMSKQAYRSRSSLLSSNLSPTFLHKVQGSMKINKPVIMSGDKAMANVRKVLNDKGGRLTDKIQQKGRKRDVSSDADGGSSEQKRMQVDHAMIANIVDDNTEGTNSPYAVFYRMSPDITEQQDTYMVLNTQNERAQHLYKEREAAMNLANENNDYKQFLNNVKIHGKVKNFSNFSNF